jgi:hypothetical protein
MIEARGEVYPSDPTALADDIFAIVRGEDTTDTDAAKIWVTSALRRWASSLPPEG